MRWLRRWSPSLAASLVVIAVTAAPAPARAQLEAPVIGVIDVQGVLRASTAVQALSREVAAPRDRTQAPMPDHEAALPGADRDTAPRGAPLPHQEGTVGG